jgi:uroporphyrin-III C-methyltransferase
VSGTVYLVGAGPGAPDLLTLRAARLLERADVVFYDALVHPDTLGLAARARKVAVGKRCGRHSTAQRFINKRLVDAAREHPVVVRLKGGDPLLFGRAQEELDALVGAGIDCEVVPGVSAAFAAAAEIGVSLTERGVSRSVVFATPRIGDGARASDWVESVLAADTAALYMAAGAAADVAAKLLARGVSADTPVVAVEEASLPGHSELPTTLGGLGGVSLGNRSGPVLLLLGEVFRGRLAPGSAERSTRRVRA